MQTLYDVNLRNTRDLMLEETDLELWLGRIVGMVINIILVIVLYKYPVRMVPLIAALLELN